MNQEELKNNILAHLNLDSSQRAEIELFFATHNNISTENFNQLFNEWQNSMDGKRANELIRENIIIEKKARIRQGITTIERGDFEYVNKESGRFGLWHCNCYVVIDRQTRFLGLITVNNEEVLPCIFDRIMPSLTGYIDTTFLGEKFTFCVSGNGRKPNKFYDKFRFGETDALTLEDSWNEIEEESEIDLIKKDLIDLLNINHRL